MDWNKVKKAIGIQPKIMEEQVNKTPEEIRREALANEKKLASEKGEAWVGVLDTQVNPDNIKNGFFELDWNNEFIEQLIDAGYQGEEPEQIVDAWFRTIAMQVLDEQGVDKDRNIGYINTSKIDDNGKSEVK